MDLLILEGFPTRGLKPALKKECTCKTSENKYASCALDVSTYPRHMGQLNNPTVYNACVKPEPASGLKTPVDKDCKCYPTEPKRPCNTLDCECLKRDQELCSRIKHKSFCPSYKHKDTCPVTKMYEEDQSEMPPPAPEEEATPLPYGLPPLKFGPCPVPGRPCSGPDGITRLLKNIPPPPAPQQYQVIGKITCSKEYERIKKALTDFQQEEKKAEFRCINKFHVDTEKRCCDQEQRLLDLLGKSCCAEHKLAAMALFKERAEREASERRNAAPAI